MLEMEKYTREEIEAMRNRAIYERLSDEEQQQIADRIVGLYKKLGEMVLVEARWTPNKR